MKLCFLICGLPRSADLVISNIETVFHEHETDFALCLSANEEKEYVNECNRDFIHQNKKVKKILFINNEEDDSYRNSVNYFKKIHYGLKLLETGYDMYFIIRSDLIFNDVAFLDNIDNADALYFSNQFNNCFTKDSLYKINEQVILCKNLDNLCKLSGIYEYNKNRIDYTEIVLYNYIHDFSIGHKLVDISYKLILSKCNIFAISGDSGSGKTTLLHYLKYLFLTDKVLELETDRYHKWERGDINYKTYTHLNPYANHLELMKDDIYNLKIGNQIFQVDYDHSTGRFTEKQHIESKNNVLLCGLHTLYNERLNQIIDLKIFMDTDRELIKKWKIQRDVNERNHSIENILKQIDAREKDYYEFIDHQKKYADIIIRFYEDEAHTLQCKLIVNQQKFLDKILKYLNKYHYLVYSDNEIQLKGEYIDLYISENIQTFIDVVAIPSAEPFYKELLCFFIIYLYL